MKQKVLFIIVFSIISSFLYSAQSDLGLETGYHSNPSEIQGGKGSAYLSSYYDFTGAFLSGENSIFFLSTGISALKYLQTKEEDMAKLSLLGRWRLKGEDSVFDLNFFAYHENLWNSADSTFFNLGLNPELRSDFDSFSLYFGARGGKFIFPDEEMDRYYAGPSIKGAFDLSWRFVLKVNMSYLYEWFDEKKVLNSSLAKTDEAVYRQIFDAGISFNYYLSPTWGLNAATGFQWQESNGNDYEETIAYLFPDYYSKKYYYGNLGLTYRSPVLEWKTEISTSYEDYDSRYPLSSPTVPNTSESLNILSVKLGTNIKYFFTKNFYVKLGGSYEMRSSNDVQEDINLYAVNAGLGLVF